MNQSNVAWAHSRKEIYLFLFSCLSREPSFQFILSLLGENIERCLHSIQGLSPSSIEFQKAIQDWKKNTKVRRRVREDYADISHNEVFRETCTLLRLMVDLVSEEIEALQLGEDEEVEKVLGIERRMIENHFSKFHYQWDKEIIDTSSTDFYRSLFYTLSEFLTNDFQELQKNDDYCIA